MTRSCGPLLAIYAFGLALAASRTCSAQDAHLAAGELRAQVSRKTGDVVSFQYRGRELLSAPARFALSALDAKTKANVALEPREVANFRATPTTASYVRKWVGAQTNVRIELTDAGLHWSVAASGPAPVRELTVEYVVPCLRDMDRVFWAAIGAPFPASDKPSGFRYPYQSVLPLATVYNTSADVGVSAIAPLELRKPELNVKFDWAAGTLHFLNNHLRLGDPWRAKTGLHLLAHAACWRPPLGWLVRQYPDWFESCPRVLAGEGYYEGCWLSSATMDDPKERKSRGVKWVESHSFWPFYGLYVPDRDPWRIIPPKERRKPQDLVRWEQGKESGREMSRQWVRDYIKAYHAKGIQYYSYVNTNEAWTPYADKYFPDSIVHRLRAPSYGGMAIMNPYEGTSWGRHMREQVRRTVECYPEQDGLFLDQNCHRGWHFGADDGVSMVNGKLCCQISFSQEQMIAFMHKLTAPRKMGIWTNYAGVGVECPRYVHGIMSEAGRPRVQNLQYLCLARPLVTCTGERTARLNEQRFKWCLSCGAFPPARWDSARQTQHIVARYQPLVDMLKGRRWVLLAHALDLPPGAEGNIFRVPNGDRIVTLVSPEASQLPRRSPFIHNLPVTIRLPDADSVKHAYLLSPDYAGPNELTLNRDRDALRLTVPAHLAASMIVLTRRDEHAIVRTSSPVLVRGEDNQLSFTVLAPAKEKFAHMTVSAKMPWGSRVAKMTSAAGQPCAARFVVPVPADASPGESEVEVSVSAQGSAWRARQRFTAWVEPLATVNAERRAFIKSESSALHATAVNHTPRPLDVTFASEPAGVLAPLTVRLKPYEHREIALQARRIKKDTRVRVRATAQGQQLLNSIAMMRVPRGPRAGDLFREPFDAPAMSNWTIQSGEWSCADGVATARGPAHWATLSRPEWRDYGVEVATKMDGSSDPTRPWVKSYIFLRMADTGNFIRFGLPGQWRTSKGFTRVSLDRCTKGRYVGTIASGRFAYRSCHWYVLRIEVAGRRVRGFVDGVLAIDAALPDDVPDAGGIGIGVQEDSMVNHYRDLVVYPIGDEAALAKPEPVGMWSFDDGQAAVLATDESGNEFDGDVDGIVSVAGKVGQAAHFDGVKSYVQAPANRAFWTSSFTFAAWVKPETFALKDRHPGPIIFSLYKNWRGPAMLLTRDKGAPCLMLRAGPGKALNLAAPRPIELNQWTHLAATYDASTHKACIYVNGKLAASAAGESQPGRGHALVLGKWFHCDGGHFTGAMDEVRWYNHALDATAIGELCQTRSGLE